jgi:signal transduction histidine kinase
LLYAALTALLSAGFLFGVLSLLSAQNEPLLRQYRLGALFLLFMAALAFEPLRQQLQEGIGRLLLRDRVRSIDLARELYAAERRADHVGRLAELGAFSSAVAHEIRNPLGVLTTYCRLLQRQSASAQSAETLAETLVAMLEQIGRAERFVEDLLRYGRPRPLELRVFDVRALIELSLSTARQGLPDDLKEVRAELVIDEEILIEADQGQLGQTLVALIDNALLAVLGVAEPRLRIAANLVGELLHIRVEDSGPGIPAELLPRLFQPFVSGRKREGGRTGTGLGLAIARGIIERHHGTIAAGRSALGGAEFHLTLPRTQALLAAAESAAAGDTGRSS